MFMLSRKKLDRLEFPIFSKTKLTNFGYNMKINALCAECAEVFCDIFWQISCYIPDSVCLSCLPSYRYDRLVLREDILQLCITRLTILGI